MALIEAAIAKQPDAIVTTRPDPAAYNDAIQKALDAGILVLTFNTNDPTADETSPLRRPELHQLRQGLGRGGDQGDARRRHNGDHQLLLRPLRP